MVHIIDKQSTNKTMKLMIAARDHKGVLACANPYAMKEKALAYGLTGFDVVSYDDVFKHDDRTRGKQIFFDELDKAFSSQHICLGGFSQNEEG